MSSTAATKPAHSAAKRMPASKNKKPESAGNGEAHRDADELDADGPSTEPDASADAKSPESPGNGHVVEPDPSDDSLTAPRSVDESTDELDPTAKLDAMGKEREALRAEVEHLRQQLERIQATHHQETAQLRTDLEESNNAREHTEEQYHILRGRVEKIKESLSDRLKRDKAELEEARERIEELEEQNEELKGSAQSSGEKVEQLEQDLQDATRELNTLRSRNNLSAHNWLKEKEELTRAVHHLKEDIETTSNAMGEWEVLAMEERSVKESLLDKVAELEEQVSTLKQGYGSAVAERDSQSTLVENLQNALREIQEARKQELREMVETTESQLRDEKQRAQDAVERSAEANEAKEALAKELERTAPFEKEVKEKNLLIGKLRHEAIVLNDHLTKALRYLKKTKPEDNVDRQVVTNHLLHFLTLDRGDAKRFQVLQVMAGYLNWTDEQREQAGLARPGASSGSLRLMLSPFHRTPSSPSLNADVFSEPASAKDKESLAELWASFLERSAKEGADEASAPPSSMNDSVGSTATGRSEPGGP
ncbi:hypothetical protein G6O67_004770 [Ophiocordyceps sinensis]|uniref:GRIP domain-containing protein n=1 Tax=Ophiocordyceps sinensis TaxID=72228 RepID=A0A8H4V5F8_9HYPO|nr:hypothetical protein G6O67_004770 [Ophiocordyceps sinensis]